MLEVNAPTSKEDIKGFAIECAYFSDESRTQIIGSERDIFVYIGSFDKLM